MNSPPAPSVASHLRAALGPGAAGPADAELLARFAAARDEGAFELLVWRHAGMVLRTCRGVLRDHHAAEDAAQAAFLALARRAGAVGRRGTVAGWLYRVACRVAGRAARRRAPAILAAIDPDGVPGRPTTAEPDLAGALHDELARLPDKYRAPVLLCYFDGLSHADAARRLGWPVGTVAGRLARARERLHRRLSRRGARLPAAGLGVVLGSFTAPAGFAVETARAAAAFTTRSAPPAGVSSTVFQLATAEIRSMLATKVQWAAGMLAVAGALTTGVWSAAQGPGTGRPGAQGQPGAKDPGRRGPGVLPRAAEDLERFRGLDPAERLRLVESRPGAKPEFPAAARGDLTAAVVERGSLDAATSADLVSAVKARGKDGPTTTIKWVVEDGTMVKKGDRLIELDDATLRDLARQAQVRVVEAEAALTAAAENFRAARRSAEFAVRLAAIEVELAAAELKEAPGKEIAALKVERAKVLLEQAKDQSKGRVTRAEADERARSAALKLEVERFRELEAELAKFVLTAPFDGVATHYIPMAGRLGGARPVIAAGETVREGQKLVRVSDLGKMVVVARVHEAQISVVRPGQSVEVRVDAIPGQAVTGKVTQVSPLPAATNWNMADVKVYPVMISLEDAPRGLKPGMTAEVRILTAERKGVLVVPTPAVLGAGRDRFCFVKSGNELVERKVVAGATDGARVEIREGLKEGDQVLANPGEVIAPRRDEQKGRPRD
jgi:RND family efflux transporter MFP subunit